MGTVVHAPIDDPLAALARHGLDQIAAAAAALLDVPLVLISTLDGPYQTYVGFHGLGTMRANAPSPLCRDVATSGRPIVMQDARTRIPASARGVWGFELVAYAGMALTLLDPARTGAFGALTSARRAWQTQDLHVLRCLADAASAILNMQAGCDESEATGRRASSGAR